MMKTGGRVHITYTVVVFVTLASLDNAAIALLPNMVLPVSEELGVSEGAVGAITAVVILVTALTAVGWGYWGDRSSRKRLLLYGTAVWAAGAFLSSTAARPIGSCSHGRPSRRWDSARSRPSASR